MHLHLVHIYNKRWGLESKQCKSSSIPGSLFKKIKKEHVNFRFYFLIIISWVLFKPATLSSWKY